LLGYISSWQLLISSLFLLYTKSTENKRAPMED